MFESELSGSLESSDSFSKLSFSSLIVGRAFQVVRVMVLVFPYLQKEFFSELELLSSKSLLESTFFYAVGEGAISKIGWTISLTTWSKLEAFVSALPLKTTLN